MKTTRRHFLGQFALAGGAIAMHQTSLFSSLQAQTPYPASAVSDFASKLQPVGRALETEDYYVWCNSPIYDASGRVHVYYSRWLAKYGMGGWINKCEIAHAVAETAKSPFVFQSVILTPRPGYFDATTCHNPTIHYFDGKYYLYYMGTSDGSLSSKRIGFATAPAPEGPWTRCEQPLLQPGPEGSWDDLCNTNPAVIRHPDGQYWMYYKALKRDEYFAPVPAGTRIRGNRRYGLAIAPTPEGPFVKYEGNPVLDFSVIEKSKQLEDAFVWHDGQKFNLICRDMGFYDNTVGLILESNDGLHFSTPKIAYYGADAYNLGEPPAPKHLSRYGRFERPQFLMKNGQPEYLFTTAQGGKYMTASSFIFRVTS